MVETTPKIQSAHQVVNREHCMDSQLVSSAQRKVFTTPLLTEAKSHRNSTQFTKKKSCCQRGGVRGAANQNATTERTNPQTKRCSKDEAAALRKNHVVRPSTAERSSSFWVNHWFCRWPNR